MKLSEDFVPSTVNEAVETLFKGLEKDDIDFIKKNDSAMVHFTFGMAMRNGWSFWQEDTPLQKDFKKRFKLFGHADDMSGLILDALWAMVRNEDPQQAMQNAAESFRKHWKKEGLDPKTGKKL